MQENGLQGAQMCNYCRVLCYAWGAQRPQIGHAGALGQGACILAFKVLTVMGQGTAQGRRVSQRPSPQIMSLCPRVGKVGDGQKSMTWKCETVGKKYMTCFANCGESLSFGL